MKTQQTKLPPEAMHVCPNCQQWQYAGKNGYYDCFNDCAEKGFAPQIDNIKLEPTPNVAIRQGNEALSAYEADQ